MPYKDMRKARKASRLKMRTARANKKVEQKGVTTNRLNHESNMLYPNVKPEGYSILSTTKPTFTAEQKLKYAKWGINV